MTGALEAMRTRRLIKPKQRELPEMRRPEGALRALKKHPETEKQTDLTPQKRKRPKAKSRRQKTAEHRMEKTQRRMELTMATKIKMTGTAILPVRETGLLI